MSSQQTSGDAPSQEIRQPTYRVVAPRHRDDAHLLLIQAASGYTIAQVSASGEKLTDDDRASANFVARAVNSHAPLLAACKAIVSATGDCGYDCRQGDVMDAIKLAKAAIESAEASCPTTP